MTALSLLEFIDQQLKAKDVRLPVFDATALEVQKLSQAKDCDARQIEKLIIRDQALAAEVLKVANSAFYGGLQKVTTIKNAIVRLGNHEITNIVMLVSQKKNFRSQDPQLKPIMSLLWQHAIGTAIGACWLAREYGFKDLAQEAFFAGLLHDAGKVFILSVIEKAFRDGKLPRKPPEPLLLEIMDSLHAERGHALMRAWNLPDKYCLVARDHHRDDMDAKNHLLLLVSVADMTANKMGIGLRKDRSLVLTATRQAELLNLSEIDIAKLEIRLEDALMLAV
jgi:HD-like signal output (HDOD) protein